MFPVHPDSAATTPPCVSPGFFCTLDDTELLTEVSHLAARERQATGDLIAALIEVDRRRLYLGEGCSSLYTYCTHILHLSEHAAYGRIQAARASAKFPAILPHLIDGSVTLTAVVLLAPHLTEQNHRALLAAARHKSKRHVEQLVARLCPQRDAPSCIRRLSGGETARFPCLATQCTGQPLAEGEGVPADSEGAWCLFAEGGAADGHTDNQSRGPADPERSEVSHTSRSALSPSAVVSPLSPDRYRVQMTIGRETLERLRAVQDLLRHTIPNGDVAAIFDRALALLHGELMKKKAAATERPRHTPPPCTDGDTASPADAPRTQEDASESPEAPSTRDTTDENRGATSRHIPAAVRRQVWARDQGRCAFVGSQGRCTETGFLEFHHLLPYAAGGEATVANIELRCRPHNRYEAERYFGSTDPLVVKESRPAYA